MISPEPRLLIVTPTLGDSPFLEKCVEAATALNLNACHILACPQARVDTLRARFPGCRVIPDEGREGGMYGAVNAALKDQKDQWEWFTYINDDDQLTPEFRKMFKQFALSKNEACIAYGDVRYIDAGGNSLGLMTTEKNPAYFIPLLLSGITPCTQQGTLVGSCVFRAIGMFESSFRHVADLDFWLRSIVAGITFRYYPLEVARFRIHTGQLSSNRAEVENELQSVMRHLEGSKCSRARRAFGWIRFRIHNIPRYLQRSKSIGWVSSRTMLTDGGPRG